MRLGCCVCKKADKRCRGRTVGRQWHIFRSNIARQAQGGLAAASRALSRVCCGAPDGINTGGALTSAKAQYWELPTERRPWRQNSSETSLALERRLQYLPLFSSVRMSRSVLPTLPTMMATWSEHLAQNTLASTRETAAMCGRLLVICAGARPIWLQHNARSWRKPLA